MLRKGEPVRTTYFLHLRCKIWTFFCDKTHAVGTWRESGKPLFPLDVCSEDRCLTITPTPSIVESNHITFPMLTPEHLSFVEFAACYTVLSLFQSFLFGLNFARWSSSIPLLCSFMKYESGSRVSCLVSRAPTPPLLALAPAAVNLVSMSPERDREELCSGQASSDWLGTTADTFALLSGSAWVGYAHCNAPRLQRGQGVSPLHSERVRLHSRHVGVARLG